MPWAEPPVIVGFRDPVGVNAPDGLERKVRAGKHRDEAEGCEHLPISCGFQLLLGTASLEKCVVSLPQDILSGQIRKS